VVCWSFFKLSACCWQLAAQLMFGYYSYLLGLV
jgi:hypothetical protein